MAECDFCDGPATTVVGVFQRRPSCQAELCAIMWACVDCATKQGYEGTEHVFTADQTPSLATYAQVEQWIEDHGMALREDPVLWVS